MADEVIAASPEGIQRLGVTAAQQSRILYDTAQYSARGQGRGDPMQVKQPPPGATLVIFDGT